MDFFNNRYYVVSKNYMIVTGIWPEQPVWSKYLSRIIMFFGFCCIWLAQTCLLFNPTMTFEIFLGNSPTYFGSCMCVSKVIALALQSKNITRLLDTVRNDWLRFNKESELEILRDYGESGRAVVTTYATAVFISIGTGIFFPLPLVLDLIMPLNETRPWPLVYQAEYFIDEKDHFFTVLLLEDYGMIVCLVTVIINDCTFIIFTNHACGMLSVLNYRLENISLENKNIAEITDKNKNMTNQYDSYIYECIRLHLHIIEYTELLKTTFSAFFLVDVGFGVLTETGAMVMVVLNKGKVSNQIMYGGMALGQLFRIFITCMPAQQLINHSLETSFAAYSGEWYDLPESSKKLLQFFIARSQQAFAVTVFGMLVMDMETFNAIIKATMSYVTVMASLQS